LYCKDPFLQGVCGVYGISSILGGVQVLTGVFSDEPKPKTNKKEKVLGVGLCLLGIISGGLSIYSMH
jgi:hypothetical protein